jgi:hypothetical protein
MPNPNDPPIVRHWKAGDTLDRTEALRIIRGSFKIPEGDNALVEGRLTLLLDAGWLTRSGDGFTRPLTDPSPQAQVPYRVEEWVPAHAVMRTVEVDGLSVRVPVEVPEQTIIRPTANTPI